MNGQLYRKTNRNDPYVLACAGNTTATLLILTVRYSYFASAISCFATTSSQQLTYQSSVWSFWTWFHLIWTHTSYWLGRSCTGAWRYFVHPDVHYPCSHQPETVVNLKHHPALSLQCSWTCPQSLKQSIFSLKFIYLTMTETQKLSQLRKNLFHWHRSACSYYILRAETGIHEENPHTMQYNLSQGSNQMKCLTVEVCTVSDKPQPTALPVVWRLLTTYPKLACRCINCYL